jgi:hypothetical protein
LLSVTHVSDRPLRRKPLQHARLQAAAIDAASASTIAGAGAQMFQECPAWSSQG